MLYFLLMMAPVVLVLVAPPMFQDKVIVDNEHFETTYGFWFDPTHKTCQFDDLRAITVATPENERGETRRELQCTMKSGTVIAVSVSDLMKFAVDDILNRADSHGIEVIENTQR